MEEGWGGGAATAKPEVQLAPLSNSAHEVAPPYRVASLALPASF